MKKCMLCKLITAMIIGLIVGSATIGLSACASKATTARIEKQQDNTFACQMRVLDYKIKQSTVPQPTFNDPRDATIYLFVKEMVGKQVVGELDDCDDALIAMVEGDIKRVNSLIDGGFKVVNGVLKLWGWDIIGGYLVDTTRNNGGTYTVNGGVNMTGSAGGGGEGGGGGDVLQGFNMGGSQNLLKEATQTQAEKLQDNSGQSGSPVLDDSKDGGGEGNQVGINPFGQ